MKKKSFILILCLLIAFAATATVLCACNPSPAAVKPLSSASDVYGLGAVSTVKLLGENISAAAVKSFSDLGAAAAENTAPTETPSETQDPVKVQAEKFNEYFVALDSFLGEDLVSTTTEANSDASIPYATKMTIKGHELGGELVTYVMYYTETLTTGNAADFDDPDDDDDDRDDIFDNDDDDDANEVKNVYSLKGIMIVDETTFYLTGERVEETEQNETESTVRIRAYANENDKLNYVQMEQEVSNEKGETETEYVYSVFANGVMVEQTAVEFETERKGAKEEVEYELEFLSGGARGRYSIERETQGNVVTIKVKYNIDGQVGHFRISEITEANGEKHYEYKFADNSSKKF